MAPQTPSAPFAAFVVAAPRSGEGKTTASLALARALRAAGHAVQAFKCGPDYIDPGFLAAATGRPCLNLDTWLMGEEGARAVFRTHARDARVALVEGVMGLLDGREGKAPGRAAPRGSTLDCARALGLPVVLVVNGRGMAHSLAPLAEGFALAAGRAGVRLAGVVATRVGSPRHAAMLRDALDGSGLPPLLGCLAADSRIVLPSRQLGLVPAAETSGMAPLMAALDELGRAIDLEGLLTACACPRPPAPEPPMAWTGPRRRLGVARDEAFCFYYEENLAWLAAHGWEEVPFSPLTDRALPDVDAVYLGGGYPEVFADRLAANATMRRSLREAAARGVPIYAECGGYMYLARELTDTEGARHAMCGVVDGVARMGTRIRSLGYREATLFRAPFGLNDAAQAPGGITLRGHEFHWSDLALDHPYPPLCRVTRRDGTRLDVGVVAGPAGNVLASYLHFYWAGGLPNDAPSSEDGRGAQEGLLLLLTGPSSAGKSTLARELASRLERLPGLAGRRVVRLSLDDMLTAFSSGQRRPASLEEAEGMGLPVLAAWHAALHGALAAGDVVVCDHVLCGRPDWEADLLARVGGARALYVRLTCDLATLEAREHARADRAGDWEHAAAQALAAAPRLPGLLELDSGRRDAAALADDILAEMARRGLREMDDRGRLAGGNRA